MIIINQLPPTVESTIVFIPPTDSGIPANAVLDSLGNAVVDGSGNYVVWSG